MRDEDAYRTYLGDIIIGEMYNSPIPGREDDTPSFQLYEKNERILWIDYGLTDQFGNKPENLVQYLRGIELTHHGYWKAQRMMQTEVRRGMIGKPPTQLTRRRKRTGVPFVRGSDVFHDWELAFWKRYHIPSSILLDEEIQALRFMNWSGGSKLCDLKSTPEDPAFIYWWSRNPASWKLYRPLATKRDKFRQEGIAGVIEGWRVLQKQVNPDQKLKVLFICSSTKDRLVVKTAFGDVQQWNGINPRGEKDRQDIMAIKDQLNDLAERVIIIYDADDPGFKGSRTLASSTGFEYFDIRGLLEGHKDFSDYVDTQRGGHSLPELKNLISNICKL